MKFHKNAEQPPCKNMELLLQDLATGKLTGIKKFYTVAHAAQCQGCGNFLSRLKVTLDILKETKSTAPVPEDAKSRLRAKIESLESPKS
jgi:hypothetical protein